MDRKNVIIVGGGAAGLMAACHIKNKNVVLVEKNEVLGRKLLITGKGRCNVTNNCSVDEILRNTLRNPKFMRSSLTAFSPEDTMNFFGSLGVELKTERGRRVFPVTDKSSTVVDALVNCAQKNNAHIVMGNVASISTNGQGDGVTGVKLTTGETIPADIVLLATGGISYPRTGSNGAGHRMAERLGHTVTDLKASLVAISCSDTMCYELMGLSLKNVSLTLKNKNIKKPLYSAQGEMLFTHFGVTGPLVLSSSCFVKGDAKEHTLHINMKPALTREQLDTRLLREVSESGTRNISNMMRTLVPQAMVSHIMTMCEIPPEKVCAELTKKERLKIVDTLQDIVLHPTELRPATEAVITVGGVSVKEVNPSTMESKLVSGLYFAGELLDIDAFTGGYNLQLAFATAVSAARAISEC